MEKITLRRCEMQDLESLQKLAYQCFKESFGPGDDPEQFKIYLEKAFHISQIKRELENKESYFYMLKKEEELAGFIKLNKGHAQTEPMGNEYLEVERIYLLKKCSGQGLGRTLI
ncbi:MAG: ribosomal protein S18 acetylase RimI-like enzyme, partial [Saprospiraceae bacterium]